MQVWSAAACGFPEDGWAERGREVTAFPADVLNYICNTLCTGNRSFSGFLETNHCSVPNVLSLLKCGRAVNSELVAIIFLFTHPDLNKCFTVFNLSCVCFSSIIFHS